MTIKHLHNGVTCLLIDAPGRLFYSSFSLKCGSDDENEDTLEAAHLLEHLNSAFTSGKYPSAANISKVLDMYGAETNATTTQRESCYWIDGPVAQSPTLLDILVHSIVDFKIDVEILSQEGEAAIRELASMLDDPWYPLDHEIDTVLFSTRPRSRHVGRCISSLRELKADPAQLQRFRRSYYTTDALLWVVSGPLQEMRTSIDSVIQLLSRMAPAVRPLHPPPAPVISPTEHVMKLQNVHNASVRLWYPVHLTSVDVEEVLCFKLAITLLVEGFSSRLMKTLRTSNGLVYNVRAFLQCDEVHPDMSYFIIETECIPNLQTARRVVHEITRALQDPISPLEQKRLLYSTRTERARRTHNSLPSRYAVERAKLVLWKGVEIDSHDITTLKENLTHSPKLANTLLRMGSPHVFIGLPTTAVAV